jgi:glycogenin glucosyltransferase
MTEAWVTLATNDAYSLGCLVLAQSLRHVKTTRKLHCMITTGVTQPMREHLSVVFDTVSVVDVLDSEDKENLALIDRPDLGVTFTKLHCWRLTQYTKCVFLDADTLLLKNSDELFEERDEFSAAPDIGWPDVFNSGVFVFAPNADTYHKLLECALVNGSFDGGDQGLLNTYFCGWRESDARYRLPFIYNMSSSAVYSYRAAYKRFQTDVKVVHFLGVSKPWHYSYNASTNQCIAPAAMPQMSESPYTQAHLAFWWALFVTAVQPQLMPHFHAVPSQSSPGQSRADDVQSINILTLTGGVQGDVSVVAASADVEHQRAWEAGFIDYAGRDSWENIQKRLDQSLNL